jgi:hypothetical protein
MKTGLLLGIFMLFGMLISCSRQSSWYTEDEVRKFVQPGTSRETIIQRFGQPIIDEKNPKFDDGSTNIDEILIYVLPPEPLPPGKFVFSGFQVRLKDGKSVEWMPTEGKSN